MEYIPCIGNSSYSFWRILLKLYSCFQDGLKICILFSQDPEIIFFLHFNLDIFSSLYAVNVWKKKAKAAFLWFHMRNLSLAGYNCSGGASCMACSFIFCMVQTCCRNSPHFSGYPYINRSWFHLRYTCTFISFHIVPSCAVWSLDRYLSRLSCCFLIKMNL